MHRTLKMVTLVVALCALIPASAFAAPREDRGVTRSVASALRSADRALDRSEAKLEDGAAATRQLASVRRHFGRAYKAATAANETARADRNWERYVDASDDALEVLADLSEAYGDESGDIAATVEAINAGRAGAITAGGADGDDSDTLGVSDEGGRGDCGPRGGRRGSGDGAGAPAPPSRTGSEV